MQAPSKHVTSVYKRAGLAAVFFCILLSLSCLKEKGRNRRIVQSEAYIFSGSPEL